MANQEIATLGGGCFWCLEAVFDEMRGVISVESGYMGGLLPNPDYHSVCTGRSGHIEVVQVTFDPAVTSYREILEVFFAIHDPTSMDRQGNDSGTQYRSAIFYHRVEQRRVAGELVAESMTNSRPSSPKSAGRDLLHCRGLSPGVLPQQSSAAVLRVCGLAES